MILLAIFSSGCISPSEPKVEFCPYIGNEKVHCIPNYPGKEEYERPIKFGDDICISTDDFAEMKKHHQELHEIIEGKNN